ncbi:MFS transporter [Serratia marcescens]|uniref:MFS transporter n=1 Tax=Serratia marcescens TaxID=615 RepID=UPI000744E3A3|nr:MFS transporter [Serratia marcescens]CUY05087.1 putative transporter [Serratia marcescens]CUY44112.1 putative transporter [Serratia marcescens]CUY80614.1 putative transporter [Serratia marcescens]CUY83324.1 putative transporter [Serratia marcescens]CVA66304.1 putative transporter [Serratia marcescens]
MKGFPSLINVLLASSLVLTIGRGVTLPFITIYLTEHFHLLPKSVGVILGVSLTLGILASLYGGYLVDKFSKNRLILLSIVLFALSFFAIPWIPRPGGVIVVLAILHTCYSVLSITIKACFADWLPVEQRIKAFSINYTLVNVGWAIGSALGVLVAGLSPLLPFYLSGGLALATVALPNFRQTVTILRSDRRLIYFTLGSTLGAVVFGQFTGYLSQYLITVSSAEFAYKIIGLVMIVNAGIVIALQYLLSRGMRQENMLRWLVLGTLFFIVGLLGFMMAGQAVWLWMVAMAVFTLGEIIVIPVEYMFIDFIAPPHLKGSYYGVQNLSALGGAINPVLSGMLLSYAAPPLMFVMLIVCALLSLLFFFLGHRLAEQAAATAEDAR